MEHIFSKQINTAELFAFCMRLFRDGAKVLFIGKSLLGAPIPCVRIGRGKRRHIVVGSHHGSESITSNVALKFCSDLLGGEFDQAEKIKTESTVFVVPMLNIDGCAIARDDFGRDSLIFSHIEKINRGCDFSAWQANARGVDLNHNYDAGFDKCKESERAAGITSPSPTRYGGEHPSSEPETAALCRLTQALAPRLSTAVALHSQGEEIYFDYCGKVPPGSRELAERMALVSGYRLSRPDEDIASHAGYKDWVIEKFGIPAFTVECGKGKNPLPPEDFEQIYKKVRPILIEAALF